ncbi:MAG: hypothetical protein WCV84_04565 [Patescibacteria group bacterium]
MITLRTKKGILTFPLDKDGVAILRLLKHHAPFLELVGKADTNTIRLVYLGEIELPHGEAPAPPNADRAQLAKLGGTS